MTHSSLSATQAREASRHANGRFGTQVRTEGDLGPGGIDLLDPMAGDLSRDEAVRSWEIERHLAQLDDPGGRIGLPNGFVARVEADASNDPDLGIIEVGQYIATQYDAHGNETGAFLSLGFDDLAQRRDQSAALASFAVRQARAGEGPPPVETAEVSGAPSAGGDFDPWEDPTAATNDPPAAPEPEPEPEPESPFPPGSVSKNGIATAPDGTRYVDDPDSFWHGTEYISTYTRAQAIGDGALVDHSAMAREAGISWPVALTRGAHGDAVRWEEANSGLQDEAGRAWDVLNLTRVALQAHARKTDNQVRLGERVPFQVMRIPNTPRATRPVRTTLHAVITSDDDGSPCITVMTPDED